MHVIIIIFLNKKHKFLKHFLDNAIQIYIYIYILREREREREKERESGGGGVSYNWCNSN